jgi:chromosome segregation ATPase
MARPGVGTEKIIGVIRELEASGHEPTATSVRERLGSGSYTTIAAVLTDWRREKASETRAQTPEPPDAVRHLMTHFWGEAWKAAMNVHEPERQAFARERQDHDRVKSEMVAEITRLEGALVSEKEQAARTMEGLQGQLTALAEERDCIRDEAQTARAPLAAAEGALVEARKQIEREAERSALIERRNQELSERVIAEAAKAQALAARVEQLEGSRR